MHIKFEGKDYFIHIKDALDHIRVIGVAEKAIRLEVPALMPEDSLLYYLKHNLSEDIADWDFKSKHNIYTVEIFDKKYSAKIKATNIPYIQSNCIYCNESYLSSLSGVEKLKEQLLLNFLNDSLSKLEEDLGMLLPAIKLRKIKTNYFSICHKTNHITFSKKLINKTSSFITYVILAAVNTFRDVNDTDGKQLIQKYVPDWKHIQQILVYERQQ